MADILDETGSPIAPTHIPPSTEFPYPEPTSSAPTAEQSRHEASIESESHRPRRLRASTDIKRPTEKLKRKPLNGNETAKPPPAIHRVESAPAPGGVEAKGSSKRDFGYAKPSGITRGVTYQFDPYSDSDSSSDEDEEAPCAPRPAQANKDADDKCHQDVPQNLREPEQDDSSYSRFSVKNANFKTKGRVSKRDGRLKISVNEFANTGYLAKTLGATLKRTLRGDESQPEEETTAVHVKQLPHIGNAIPGSRPLPALNIVIIVIGSRGDIQPFLKIGKTLKEQHGHRVRIATHPAFKEFVEQDSQLEFFSIGGDPSELMAFMVKNPGLIPSVETVKGGEIGRRRSAMAEMFEGMWRACINATDDETDEENLKMMGHKAPFVADAIIANPPSFAHIHIAERLGIPLHMMFTFPYTPTVQFPHPLANIKSSNVDPNYTNFMSYPLVEMMTWQGLGDLVNRFRTKTLGLEPVSTIWAPGQLYRLKVPYTYMWSPGLVPKPPDWGPEVDVCGFVYLDLASSFEPPDNLVQFLEAGEPPVYIGFGSIVVDDPNKFTQLIFDAVKMAGCRALVSKGWGGLGSGDLDLPDNIFLLENTPHDWLFPRVSAVVHHGGAGTTAAGLKCAKPTMIVPFFGDQPFWGAMVSSAKAGAHECIPYKKLTKERLAEGIKQCLTDEARENVQKIADCIAKDGDGATNAVESFHRSLPLRGQHSLRCSILEDRVAVWHMKATKLRLSALAADILVEQRKLKWQDLRLIRHKDWTDFGGPGEPATGVASAVFTSAGDAAKGVGQLPIKLVKNIEKREKHEEKRKKHMEKMRNRDTASDTNGSAHDSMEEQTVENNKVPESEQSRRPPAPQRENTASTTLSADPEDDLMEEFAHDARRGFRKTGSAIVTAPINISVAVAQGFHNAPRLYGDDTVRQPVRISGFKSGLHAGRNEFVYGIHDAFTGLYQHPIRGAKDDGVLGFFRGIGLGIGGFVLKDIAAIIGPPAYMFKGIHKQTQRHKQPTHFLRRARITQGYKDMESLSDEERQAIQKDVDHGWDIVSQVLDLERQRLEESIVHRWGLRKKRREWKETGAIESVATAEKALEAREKGIPIADFLGQQEEEARISSMPRIGVLDKEAEDQKARVESDENARVLENGRMIVAVTSSHEKNDEAPELAKQVTVHGSKNSHETTRSVTNRGLKRNKTEIKDFAGPGEMETSIAS